MSRPDGRKKVSSGRGRLFIDGQGQRIVPYNVHGKLKIKVRGLSVENFSLAVSHIFRAGGKCGSTGVGGVAYIGCTLVFYDMLCVQDSGTMLYCLFWQPPAHFFILNRNFATGNRLGKF